MVWLACKHAIGFSRLAHFHYSRCRENEGSEKELVSVLEVSRVSALGRFDIPHLDRCFLFPHIVVCPDILRARFKPRVSAPPSWCILSQELMLKIRNSEGGVSGIAECQIW